MRFTNFQPLFIDCTSFTSLHHHGNLLVMCNATKGDVHLNNSIIDIVILAVWAVQIMSRLIRKPTKWIFFTKIAFLNIWILHFNYPKENAADGPHVFAIIRFSLFLISGNTKGTTKEPRTRKYLQGLECEVLCWECVCAVCVCEMFVWLLVWWVRALCALKQR